MILSVYHFSLITVGMHFVVSINWVSKPTRILNIKGNSCNSEMPSPHSRAHRLFVVGIKWRIIHLDMVSVYTNLDDFKRSVEGAMKLLRAWFRNFQCIFHLAKLNNCNFSRKNYCGIKICILYVWKYFEEFINFVEGVVGHMNFWWGPWLLFLAVAVPQCGWLNFWS
jgi:hypothetical protein